MRKLIIFSVFAGASASLPILYEQSPDTYIEAVRSLVGPQPQKAEKAPARPLVVVQQLASATSGIGVSGRQVRIDAAPNGHFEAEFRLNGRPVHAMVDTGATVVAINRTLARQIGINLSPADFRYEVKTANGQAAAAVANIGRLQIGRIEVADVQAVVMEDRSLDGVLVGMSFLSRLASYRVEGGSLLMQQ